MSGERTRRLGELLEIALEHPPPERRAALLAVSDDAVLIAEALALLSQQEGLGDFLEHNAFERLETSGGLVPAAGGIFQPPAVPGDRIGRYTLLESLGEGGMGQVFLAEQTDPVERRVALKLVRGSLAGAEAQGRLLAERRALARLHHPNVAHLFDAATTRDGRPYFVMELVDGPPLTEYCDRHRLSLDARLELFSAVCQGVQHAHQKQLLHRDLKPSNILVAEIDGRPVPKIIDFGIAKALDQPLTDEPMTGDRAIGTPSYMSPEALVSVHQDLDTRTDIYALGVLLHELLAGCRPFAEVEGVPPAELMSHYAERVATAPSTRLAALPADDRQRIARARGTRVAALLGELRADLDWIVLRAIARRREDRYASAAELAADVERYRRHEPVLAHPPRLGYTLGKLFRRHLVAAGVGGLTVVGVAAGVFVTSLALIEARRAEDAALEEVVRARAETAAAEARRQATEGALRSLAGAFPVESFDASILPSSAEAGGIPGSGELEPLVQASLAQALGEEALHRGHLAEARTQLAEALRLRRAELGDTHPDLAPTLALLGEAEAGEGRLEEAADHLRRAFEIQNVVLDREDPALAQTR
ncbi:MAG: serine/threonine protein kinase, partial [Acidobacteria bacterium]|nr:serine/threonine protein kinase [Acidobacteriota bacterium]